MSRTQRLLVVLVLNLALVAGLVITGVTAHSLAVLAAGGDYLLDAAGVGVALLAIRLSARRAGNGPRQGSLNASSVAALINSGWLLALEVLVAAAAIDRRGPNKDHGFGSSGPPNRSVEEHRESIRAFLAMIDPDTGYIGDD